MMTSTGKSGVVHIFCCTVALLFMSGCSAEPSTEVEEAIFRIEDRLADVDSKVDALAEPPTIADDCIVEFAAYGLDDPGRLGYINTTGGSSEEILVPNDPTRNRGITLVELDPTTCMTRNRQRFDTFGVAVDIIQMTETIDSAVLGTIIIGVTADSADLGGNLDLLNPVSSIFTRYNMNIQDLRNREKFAFIMQKGYPKKTIFERKPASRESISMKVQVHGPNVFEAILTRIYEETTTMSSSTRPYPIVVQDDM